MKNLPLYVVVLCASLLISCTSTTKDLRMITKTVYGTLPDAREAHLFVLKNATGASVSITNYGATVTSLRVPNRTGTLEDVVLGYDSLQKYIDGKSYFGGIVGRYGNRIAKGRFPLDGKTIHLTINDGENQLHGGVFGFNKKLWDVSAVRDTGEASITLTYVSPDGEEGFPGTVTLAVTYTWTESNGLRVEYAGTTDKRTVLNPTNHAYFNLSGSFTNPILDHELFLDADAFTPVNDKLIPTGTLAKVENTPMDYRTPKAIGNGIDDKDEQLAYGKGYDHNWVLRGFDRSVRKVAELYDPKSGRSMTILTDQPGIQFYSGNFLNGTEKGKRTAFQFRTGLCLETQCFPDSPNNPSFPSVVLNPGEKYRQTTIYQFSVR
jgi:aldose 1-epimerase